MALTMLLLSTGIDISILHRINCKLIYQRLDMKSSNIYYKYLDTHSEVVFKIIYMKTYTSSLVK